MSRVTLDDPQYSTSQTASQAAVWLVQTAISHREAFRVLKYRDVWHVKRVPLPRRGASTDATISPRGSITKFSRRSRKRLLEALAEARATPTHFITLTYPREWPKSPREWKRHLDAFLKRLRRRWPESGYVWRLEFQKRGAPHYHILAYGVDGVSDYDFRMWIREAWYEIVDSGDERHLYAGTQASPITNHAHAARYASKYAAKVDGEQLVPDTGGEAIGRFWAAGGNLCRDVIEVITISRDNVIELKRTIRKWLRSRGAHQYARRLAKLPPEYGLSVLGLGAGSLRGLTFV